MLGLLRALDSGKSAFLVILDLSAAFDTISQENSSQIFAIIIVMNRNVLSQIRAYLEHRLLDNIKTGTTFSEVKESNIGVPQGIGEIS